ncbi:MAG: hypothetical protein U9P38_04825 [Campylobacterota bacterium]|nr:hypothetical protein [Campylobacterota bacterium]
MRFLLILFFIVIPFSLNAKSLVNLKAEIGIFLPEMKGTITNTQGSSDFKDDYQYEKAKASFFSLDLDINRDYIPSLYISYLNMKTNQDSSLSSSARVADGDFNASVSTYIDYSIINTTIYKDFMRKGAIKTIFGSHFYTGDLELDIGVNIKAVKWNFEIKDKVDLTKTSSWIDAGLIVPIPYLGIKYYLYDLSLYTTISALSLSEAKLMSYEVGLDYRVVNSIYLSGVYLYERFEAVEEDDTIGFTIEGYKFSFKYIF